MGSRPDARSPEHVTQLSTHVRGGQRSAVPGLEQQFIQAHAPGSGEPSADRVGGERGQCNNAARLGGLGVVLPESLLPFFGRQRTVWRIWPFSRINVPPTRAALISWSMPHCADATATDFPT